MSKLGCNTISTEAFKIFSDVSQNKIGHSHASDLKEFKHRNLQIVSLTD